MTVMRTFEVKPGNYHVDMSLALQFSDKAKSDFVYKLTGPRGMPIEGIEWQQRPYRQVVVGTVDAKDGSSPRRTLILPHPIREGKAEAVRLSGERQVMQYAGIMVQYFAARSSSPTIRPRPTTSTTSSPSITATTQGSPPTARSSRGRSEPRSSHGRSHR